MEEKGPERQVNKSWSAIWVTFKLDRLGRQWCGYCRRKHSHIRSIINGTIKDIVLEFIYSQNIIISLGIFFLFGNKVLNRK